MKNSQFIDEPFKQLDSLNHFHLFSFQGLQADQGKNSPNTPTTTAGLSSVGSRNQNHNTEHLATATSLNNHHMGPNTGSHRFHPYSRSDGNVAAKVDASRDPRLKLRGNNNGNNGNASGPNFISSSTNGNNGHPNADPSARNVINTSRDPRTRR